MVPKYFRRDLFKGAQIFSHIYAQQCPIAWKRDYLMVSKYLELVIDVLIGTCLTGVLTGDNWVLMEVTISEQ